MAVVMKNVIILIIIMNYSNKNFYSRTHRGKGLAAFLKAIGYLIPLVSTVFHQTFEFYVNAYLMFVFFSFYRWMLNMPITTHVKSC